MARRAASFLVPALEAANVGLPVFPCRPGNTGSLRRQKQPAIRAWPAAATTDAQQILAWGEEHPDANIGIAARGLIVLDVDSAEGERQLARLPDFPPTAETSTRRGRHIYFRGLVPSGCVGALGDGLDVRGNKAGTATAYVLAPGSVVGGFTYCRSNDLGIAAAPPELIEAVSQKRRTRLDPEAPILEGSRNVTLTRHAGRLFNAGLKSESMLEPPLQALNRERCLPPLPEDEVAEITRSAVRNFDAPPWMALPHEVGRWCAGDRLSAKAVAVLRCLADHADIDGRCWPSVETISRITGLDRKTVFPALDELRRAGRVSTEPRPFRSTIYVLSPLCPPSGSSCTRNGTRAGDGGPA